MEFRKLGNIVRDILHSPGYGYTSIIEGYRLKCMGKKSNK